MNKYKFELIKRYKGNSFGVKIKPFICVVTGCSLLDLLSDDKKWEKKQHNFKLWQIKTRESVKGWATAAADLHSWSQVKLTWSSADREWNAAWWEELKKLLQHSDCKVTLWGRFHRNLQLFIIKKHQFSFLKFSFVPYTWIRF